MRFLIVYYRVILASNDLFMICKFFKHSYFLKNFDFEDGVVNVLTYLFLINIEGQLVEIFKVYLCHFHIPQPFLILTDYIDHSNNLFI